MVVNSMPFPTLSLICFFGFLGLSYGDVKDIVEVDGLIQEESAFILKKVDIEVDAVQHLKKFGKLGINYFIGVNEKDEKKTFLPYLNCQNYNSDNCKQRGTDCEGTVQCIGNDPIHSSKRLACMANFLYHTSSNKTFSEGDIIEPELKGCWYQEESQLRECLEENQCFVDMRKTDHINRVALFCCCRTHNCNRRMIFRETERLSIATFPPLAVPSLSDPPDGLQFVDLPFIIVIVFLFTCVLCALGLLVQKLSRKRCAKPKMLLPFVNGETGEMGQDKMLLGGQQEEGAKCDEQITLSDGQKVHKEEIELREIVSNGRFGKVHKASVVGQNCFVAVKIVPAKNSDSWENEKALYSIESIRTNEHIAQFYGGFPFGASFWLVFEFYENSSLSDLLRLNTLSIKQSVNIICSMLDGLAFLHGGVTQGPNQRPNIVHRDFKSKNILITSEMDVRIADFGLALKCENHIMGAEKNHGQVGTVRYMSPEVLEGATDFTCFAFQQSDVYAAALVIWEVLSRTETDENNCDEYALPYEKEVGQNPTVNQMRSFVVTQRCRPTTREALSRNKVLLSIARTMREMWEHEPDGRVTSSCARERLFNIRKDLISRAASIL